MPDRRRHRGPHPQDTRLFASTALPVLRTAVSELSWLLTRSYAEKSALQLVGNRHGLTARQRQAVLRASCSDGALGERLKKRRSLDELAGAKLAVDGYNVLITIESALSGGLIIAARDGAYRDLASIHGTYQRVEETVPAIRRVGDFLARRSLAGARWLLDAPVSNSGRLAKIVSAVARENGWKWTCELVADPDPVLAETELVAASSDSFVLDRARAWVNLARELIEAEVPEAWVVELGG